MSQKETPPMVSERHVSRSKATDVSGLDIPTRRPFIGQPPHLLEFPNLTVRMAPRDSVRGASLPEPGSDQGLDLTLSLSVGGAGRKRAAEMEVVQECGMQVKKQRKCEGGIVGGVSGAGWFMSESGCHAQLEKLVPVGTDTRRSTSVVSDRDSVYLIGGSGTNSDSSTTTTTEQSKLNSHLSTHNTQYVTKPTHQNPKPNRIFPKMPHMPFVAVKAKEPNTPSITGFLYRVTETAEVFIVCACHGTFFSPTGFVEHAGWTNVINPLRLIVVKPY